VSSRDGRGAFIRRADRLTRNVEVVSLRMDIPKTDRPPDRVPQKGGNEFLINDSSYNLTGT
jgi:hypothetical protein